MAKPVVIVGAGVIGLSIGWHLVQRGQKVYLFDQGLAGAEASSQAAGMITPASEIRFGEDKLFQLLNESCQLYPQFVQHFESSFDYHDNGSLMVAIDQDDEAELTRLYDYQKSLDLPVQLLTPTQIQKQEPQLTHRCHRAIYAPWEKFLDNKKLIQALKKSFIKMGGHLIENQKVTSVNIKNKTVQSVSVANETVEASDIVVATGNHFIAGLKDHLSLPLRSIKGQAIEIQCLDKQILHHAIRTMHRYPVYIVPRSDGRLIIGASVEETPVNKNPTAGVLMELLYATWRVLPAAHEMTFLNTWSGQRPAVRDNLPVLGPTKITGLHLAMGLYRHGILLSPLVGQIIADLIVDKKDSPYFDSFSINRFT